MTLLLNELYTAPQGEGPRTGEMTQFVRFAGCNMRCPGWPCDTQHASVPALWRHDHTKNTPEELYEKVAEWPLRLCLTGGEPFLQPDGDLNAFVRMAVEDGYFVEAFTNGSFIYPDWVRDLGVRLIMDWKLTSSGEANTTIENRLANAHSLNKNDVIKFVVADEDDMNDAVAIYYRLRSRGVHAQFSCGAVWGRIEDAQIVDWIKDLKLDWTLNVQVHKHIYTPEQRGI